MLQVEFKAIPQNQIQRAILSGSLSKKKKKKVLNSLGLVISIIFLNDMDDGVNIHCCVYIYICIYAQKDADTLIYEYISCI